MGYPKENETRKLEAKSTFKKQLSSLCMLSCSSFLNIKVASDINRLKLISPNTRKMAEKMEAPIMGLVGT